MGVICTNCNEDKEYTLNGLCYDCSNTQEQESKRRVSDMTVQELRELIISIIKPCAGHLN